MLHVLAAQQLLTQSTEQHGAPCFVKPKTPHKARLIANLVVYNTLFSDPPHFHLPQLSALLADPTLSCTFLTKIDLANCYWSILIPPEVQGHFSLSAGTTVYATRRLPFGWKWSPVLCQQFVHSLLTPALRLLPTILQFYDDILLFHPDSPWLTCVTEYVVYLLQAAGLLISPKSALHPVRELVWLGKHISSLDGIIANLSIKVAKALVATFYLRYQQPYRRSLAKLLGAVQWLTSPSKHAAPFLAAAYSTLHHTTTCRKIPFNVWKSLLFGVLTCTLSARAHKPLPSPLLPVLFTDAAPTSTAAYCVAAYSSSFATSAPTPSWITTLNQAELYGVFHSLRQAALRRLTMLNLTTDSTYVFFTLTRWQCPSQNPTCTRILRRIWRLALFYQLNFTVSLVPSGHNDADILTRSSPDTCIPNLLKRGIHCIHPFSTYSSTIPMALSLTLSTLVLFFPFAKCEVNVDFFLCFSFHVYSGYPNPDPKKQKF